MRDIMPPDEKEEGLEPVKVVSREREEKDVLLRKLGASRVTEEVEPLRVTHENLDALRFPPDLLYDPFPDERPKSDLLTHYFLQKRAKLVFKPRSPKERPTSAQKPGFVLPSATSILAGMPLMAETRSPIRRKREEEEEQMENVEALHPVSLQSLMPAPISSSAPGRTARKLRNKTKIRMRTVFYVLRCWAHYKLNARAKATFTAEVYNSRITLHWMREWHHYAAEMGRLKRREHSLMQWRDTTSTSNCWQLWKRKAGRAIRDVGICNRAVEKLEHGISTSFFREWHETAHNHRVLKIEEEKAFRYKPEGPFTELNPNLTLKRTNFIKS
jgi:hypothetical protein